MRKIELQFLFCLMLFLGLNFFPPTAHAFTSADIIVYYNLDGATPTDYYTTPTKDMSCQSGLVGQTGKFTNAFYFNGTGGTNDTLACETSASTIYHPSGNSFTMSGWFNATTSPASQYVLMGLSGDGTASGCYGGCIQPQANKLRFCFYTTNSHWACYETGALTLYDGIWHNVVFVGEYTNMVNSGKFYLDNVLISGSWNNTTYANEAKNISSATNIRFSAGSAFTTTNNIYKIKGKIDDIVFFNKKLSTTEIQSLYSYSANSYVVPGTFQIQLLTPSPISPLTTYYGQPASYTFNYLNPLNWYPQIRFMVKRQADARASAWPDYVNSATFWTTSVASSTLTYGTASFQLPDGYYDLRVDYWANIPPMLGVATTTFTINSGGSYGGYSFATSTLLTPPTFSTAELCNNIATSTTFGAIECGMLKALVGTITWAFAPSFDTLTNFRASFELFKGCFPFNTYFQLTDAILSSASSTATSTQGTIKIPFIQTITGGGNFYMLDAVSSSTLSNWIGVSNYNLFRTTIGYFFWLIAVAVVYFTVKFI
jgi:hypothetical protein